MGYKVPRHSRDEISFGGQGSKFYSDWNLRCKQFFVFNSIIMIIMIIIIIIFIINQCAE